MDLSAGTRVRSQTCETEAVVVKGAGDVDLRCGGRPVVPATDSSTRGGPPEPPFDTGTLLGKRYVTGDQGVELLCTKQGTGTLSVGDEPLDVKGAKPLPSSD